MQRTEDLARLLDDHRPFDDEEASHLAHMRALLAREQPFAREAFSPGHFTASAFILAPTDDALLLIFHGKLSRWLQPGGHVEPDDASILDAARRELREEVGLSDLPLALPGIFDLDVHEIPARRKDPAHTHFDVRFLFRARDLSFVAASDAKAARWVAFDEIDEQISDRSVTRAVDKLRAR